MAEQGLHAALIFNQFDYWRQWAEVMLAAGVPVNFVHPADEMNRPKYILLEPGHSPPQTPSLKWVSAPARKIRRALRVTEEHKKEVKRECTARHDEKRRILKIFKRWQDGTLGQPGRPRKRKSSIRSPGHAPTTS